MIRRVLECDNLSDRLHEPCSKDEPFPLRLCLLEWKRLQDSVACYLFNFPEAKKENQWRFRRLPRGKRFLCGIEQDACQVRDRFISWLAANHPELGIDNQSTWIWTAVRLNILVVEHYLFLSDDWEIGVSWHVTIPSSDSVTR